jgi:hypothetical protein
MAVAPTSGPVLYKPLSSDPIEPHQWAGGDTVAAVPAWVANRVHVSSGHLHVPTRSGTLAAAPGDWVYQEPDGQLAVMDNALFHATYEPVKAPDESAPGYVPVIPPREPLVPMAVAAPAKAAPATKAA